MPQKNGDHQLNFLGDTEAGCRILTGRHEFCSEPISLSAGFA
jgi:hypothetical protein